jgi:hypothetical protein
MLPGRRLHDQTFACPFHRQLRYVGQKILKVIYLQTFITAKHGKIRISRNSDIGGLSMLHEMKIPEALYLTKKQMSTLLNVSEKTIEKEINEGRDFSTIWRDVDGVEVCDIELLAWWIDSSRR